VPVSALVITLDAAVVSARDLPDVLRDGRLELGRLLGARLPAVLETATLEEAERFVESLFVARGISFVDVVSVDFSDVAPEGP
jgi:hypothetical protein